MEFYPLTFRPIAKERVWGGTQLKELYGKPLPPGVPIGESWEVTDRPGDVSAIVNGPLTGRDLRWLLEQHRSEIMGDASLQAGRFPLLIKILDCQQKLSLQVHPPAAKAAQLAGEAKTEMWYIASAKPGAELYVGLKHGVTPKLFEQKIRSGTVADCFHRVSVRSGDAMFLPSGRVHAIGGGSVIFEIQQNSDTTYRVFDWNRVGLDGKPRPLHVAESLGSIDFNDFEPSLIGREMEEINGVDLRRLVDHELFKVEVLSTSKESQVVFAGPKLRLLGVVEGGIKVRGGAGTLELNRGQFCLIPAAIKRAEVVMVEGTTLLNVEPGAKV